MASGFSQETDRIRDRYSRRDAAGKAVLYAWHRADVGLHRVTFQRGIADLFARADLLDLSDLDILDVGCGTGAWLRTLQEWGAKGEKLHGVDLLADRIQTARSFGTSIDYRHMEGWPVPFEDGSMDLVSAHTVLSSILDADARADLAQEMTRITRRGGHILVYDFRISHPDNPDTVGIGAGEIRRLFPGLPCRRKSVTLAPPLAHRLAPLSALAVLGLEAVLPFLRSHALYLLTREDPS